MAIAAPHENALLENLSSEAAVEIETFDLSLPQVTALASRSQLFVGNDSGIAHIAAAEHSALASMESRRCRSRV